MTCRWPGTAKSAFVDNRTRFSHETSSGSLCLGAFAQRNGTSADRDSLRDPHWGHSGILPNPCRCTAGRSPLPSLCCCRTLTSSIQMTLRGKCAVTFILTSLFSHRKSRGREDVYLLMPTQGNGDNPPNNSVNLGELVHCPRRHETKGRHGYTQRPDCVY